MVPGSSILVTGGTGSFGKAFIARVLRTAPHVERVVVFSRDELKQYDMAQEAPFDDPRMRFFLGDVRDADRVRRALEGIDCVVHAAALKQVPAAEYNPFEAVKTNVLGAQNVIEAALDRGVKRVVALSTDKAAAPINLYGATKLTSDKLFVAANHYKGTRDLKLSVVRYGNVMGSRGSVIPFFMKKRSEGVLPITHPEMTRFNITLDEGVDLVLFALTRMWGGEIFVPKLPSYKVVELARAVAPWCTTEIVGVRPGEKIHEEMLTATDALHTLECARHFVIKPSLPLWEDAAYCAAFDAAPTTRSDAYQSGTNTEWLDVDALRVLLRTHVDPAFTWERT